MECLVNADCTTSSFGSTCDTTTTLCTCAADSDCANNIHGTTCDTIYDSICNCADPSTGNPNDQYCIGGRKCTGTYPLDTYETTCQ